MTLDICDDIKTDTPEKDLLLSCQLYSQLEMGIISTQSHYIKLKVKFSSFARLFSIRI